MMMQPEAKLASVRGWVGPLALAALAATLVPPLLFSADLISEAAMKAIMLVGAAGWFLMAPWWLRDD